MKKEMLILLGIVLLGAFLRFFRIEDLMLFRSDQAIDSAQVVQMLRGHFTLLGPSVSVGGFFNGPIVYYLMLPFYWLFQGYPVAGTVFQSIFSLATIPLIFILGKKLKNEMVGLFAAFLFAISPLTVDYSRAVFNAYPAEFFAAAILVLFVFINERFSLWKTILMGTCLGFIVQMHYLTFAMVLMALLYPVFFSKKLVQIPYYVGVIGGFIIGLSPYLLFELRHQFFNTQAIINYFLTSDIKTQKSFIYIISIWPDIMSKLALGNNFLLGLLGSLGVLGTLIKEYLETRKLNRTSSIMIFLLGIVFAEGLVYRRLLISHYIISIHAVLICLFALGVWYLLKKNMLFIGFAAVLLLILNSFTWPIVDTIHPLQDGVSEKDFQKVAKTILREHDTSYNVAMDLQGDNRAMPIRFFLDFFPGNKPLSVEQYGNQQYLYMLVKTSKKLSDLTMWEYTSFGLSKVENKWIVNDEYTLYKLQKRS